MAVFHSRLRSLRISMGLSQQKLADELRTVSKSSINMYERGDREPSLNVLVALADFFVVDLDYLLCRSDVPSSPSRGASAFSGYSTFEKTLVSAYHSRPEMQPAVNCLLRLPVEGNQGNKDP